MKILIALFCLLLQGCFGDGCGFSERCYRERERERIWKLSPEERKKERGECVTSSTYMINMAKSFDDKEKWERRKKKCDRYSEESFIKSSELVKVGCSFSESCESKMEEERITKLSPEERASETERCITDFNRLFGPRYVMITKETCIHKYSYGSKR